MEVQGNHHDNKGAEQVHKEARRRVAWVIVRIRAAVTEAKIGSTLDDDDDDDGAWNALDLLDEGMSP